MLAVSPQTRSFECLACGSQLEFAAGSLSTQCTMCEDDRPLPLRFAADVPGVDVAPREAVPGPLPGHTHYRCDGCGALLSAADVPSKCPHCAGSVQPQSVAAPLMRPHAVLPFRVDGVLAKAMLGKALAKHKVNETASELHRIYVPWLVFDTVAHGTYDGELGVYEKHGEHTVLVWQPRSGRVERHFENRRRTASRSLSDHLATELEPFDWAFAEPARDALLADVICERTELGVDAVFGRTMASFDADVREAAMHDIGGDQQRVHRVNCRREGDRFRLVMLPVWVGALQPSGNRVAVNGRTGSAVLTGFASAADHDSEVSAYDPGHRTKLLVGGALIVAAVALFIYIATA